jgi:hypothetical protein
MKVKTNNEIRTIHEMSEMWRWMTDTYGAPEAHNSNLKRWTYGKDNPGYTGSMFIDGTFDIEWFDFRDQKDADWFIMRWGT